MSTTATAILDQIKTLPEAEQQEVLAGVTQLQTRRGEWEKQRADLREMQARHAGSGLRDRLLDERAKEREPGGDDVSSGRPTCARAWLPHPEQTASGDPSRPNWRPRLRR